MTSPSDRRGESRRPIELKVEYLQLNSFFADYTKNISRGGTFIATTRPLPLGTEFVFKLGVPTLPEPLTLVGKVQWIVHEPDETEDQPAGMGIGFIFESQADRDRVQQIIEDLMRRQLGPVLSEKLLSHRPRER
ncbi:MAG TPA: TIGR02266 family protein [Polyangiales bacterium]|nr:TIGR02266 family protein [Polyangiales bacterium]